MTLDQLFSGTRTNTCDIFAGLSVKALECFDEHMLRRVFFPGEMAPRCGCVSLGICIYEYIYTYINNTYIYMNHIYTIVYVYI